MSVYFHCINELAALGFSGDEAIMSDHYSRFINIFLFLLALMSSLGTVVNFVNS